MGKSVDLNWYVSQFGPRTEGDQLYKPIIYVTAPILSNKWFKMLCKRLLFECSGTYLKRASEETLIEKLSFHFQQADVKLVIIDEVDFITRSAIRDRLLEIPSLKPDLTLIGVSTVTSLKTITEKPMIADGWDDYFELKPYTGSRLIQLLAFLELLLPFPKDSLVTPFKVTSSENYDEVDNIPYLIEQWTGGNLGKIMPLIIAVSIEAIRRGESNLSQSLLSDTWRKILCDPGYRAFIQLPVPRR